MHARYIAVTTYRCTHSTAVAGDLGREETSKEEKCEGEEQSEEESQDSMDGQ